MPHVTSRPDDKMIRSKQDQPGDAALLDSSLAYHQTLIDQHRQLQSPTVQSDTRRTQTTRPWFPLTGWRANDKPVHDDMHIPAVQVDHHNQATASTANTATANGGVNVAAMSQRQHKLLAVDDRNRPERPPKPISTLGIASNFPEPSREAIQEYEALPLAIQRKFFSSAERLRLAKSSEKFLKQDRHNLTQSHDRARKLLTVDHRSWATAFHSNTVASRSRNSPLDIPCVSVEARPVTSPLPSRATDITVQNREQQLTRQEQLSLARQLRQSVLLDAADEALYRIGQQKTGPTSSQVNSSSSPTEIDTTGAMPHQMTKEGISSHDSVYDSFRWFDEDDELDLRLDVDNPQVPPRSVSSLSKRESHPFRRGLSFTRMSFNRSSISSIRPTSRDTTPQVDSSRAASPTLHGRRKSRTFSIMGAKHTSRASVASIDPGAAHYQDPAARAKLRVYLASPQKFDEAVEFGFPSAEAANVVPRRASTRQSRHMSGDDSNKMRTFLSDDRSSTYSEDLSVPDTDSPKTPQMPDKDPLQVLHMPFDFDENQLKLSDGYMHAPAHSREMTLRMTLTRPDLRAQEDQMYGWQQAPRQQPAWRHSRTMTQSRWEAASTSDVPRETPNGNMEKIFADIDQELGPLPSEGGAMKRLWKRVRPQS